MNISFFTQFFISNFAVKTISITFLMTLIQIQGLFSIITSLNSQPSSHLWEVTKGKGPYVWTKVVKDEIGIVLTGKLEAKNCCKKQNVLSAI